jgi:hypothetical protein
MVHEQANCFFVVVVVVKEVLEYLFFPQFWGWNPGPPTF